MKIDLLGDIFISGGLEAASENGDVTKTVAFSNNSTQLKLFFSIYIMCKKVHKRFFQNRLATN